MLEFDFWPQGTPNNEITGQIGKGEIDFSLPQSGNRKWLPGNDLPRTGRCLQSKISLATENLFYFLLSARHISQIQGFILSPRVNCSAMHWNVFAIHPKVKKEFAAQASSV